MGSSLPYSNVEDSVAADSKRSLPKMGLNLKGFAKELGVGKETLRL